MPKDSKYDIAGKQCTRSIIFLLVPLANQEKCLHYTIFQKKPFFRKYEIILFIWGSFI